MKSVFASIAFCIINLYTYSQSQTLDTVITVNAHAKVVVNMPTGKWWTIGTDAYSCITANFLERAIEITSKCDKAEKISFYAVSKQKYDDLILHHFQDNMPSLGPPEPK